MHSRARCIEAGAWTVTDHREGWTLPLLTAVRDLSYQTQTRVATELHATVAERESELSRLRTELGNATEHTSARTGLAEERAAVTDVRASDAEEHASGAEHRTSDPLAAKGAADAEARAADTSGFEWPWRRRRALQEAEDIIRSCRVAVAQPIAPPDAHRPPPGRPPDARAGPPPRPPPPAAAVLSGRQWIGECVARVPYGVLGTRRLDASRGGAIVRVAPAPGANVAFVDPAGLRYVHSSRGPRGAGGAAGANYAFLGISRDEAFPRDVVEAVRACCARGRRLYHVCLSRAGSRRRCLPSRLPCGGGRCVCG